jgi:hypothetical protein
MAEARSTTHTAILLTALGFVMVAPHGTLSLRSTSSDRGGSWLDLDEPVEAANELEEVSLANRIHVEVLLHPMAFCAWEVLP